MSVLKVFHGMCNDSEALVEIFINYDCDLQEIDLFRQIIDALAKIAKTPSTGSRSGVEFMSSSSREELLFPYPPANVNPTISQTN